MADTAFPKGAEKILSGAIDFETDTIKVALLPSTYTYSTSHEFLAQLGSRIGTDQALTSKTIAGGVFDAADPTWPTLAPGNTIKAVVLYKDTGNASTSPVLAYFDSLAGLPMATNGGDVSLPWSNEVKKIFRLNLPFFPLGGELLLGGGVNFLTASLKVALLPATYTYDAAHQYLSDLGATVGTAQALASKAITGGVFDAADVDFGALTGAAVGSAVIYVDAGSAAASPVLLHIKDVVGMPFTPNGAGFGLDWSNASAKIFSLVAA